MALDSGTASVAISATGTYVISGTGMALSYAQAMDPVLTPAQVLDYLTKLGSTAGTAILSTILTQLPIQLGDIATYINANISGGGSFTPNGDLGGTSTATTVIKINGASVPVAGALVPGNVLTVTSATALGYSPLPSGAPTGPKALAGSCILRWLCNDAVNSGTIVCDGSVGATANLTVQNTTSVVQGESGLFCDACDFIPNGATGGWSKSANNVGNPSSTTLLTLHGWIKPLGTQNSFGRVVTKLYNATGVTPFDAVCILFNSTTLQISTQWTSGAASKTATSLAARYALQANVWQYVAVTFSQTSTTMTVNFYLNGNLVSTQAVTSGAFDWNAGSAGPWCVGGCSFAGTLSGETFNGHLMDWRVEDGAALSLATIRANYKYGVGLNY